MVGAGTTNTPRPGTDRTFLCRSRNSGTCSSYSRQTNHRLLFGAIGNVQHCCSDACCLLHGRGWLQSSSLAISTWFVGSTLEGHSWRSLNNLFIGLAKHDVHGKQEYSQLDACQSWHSLALQSCVCCRVTRRRHAALSSGCCSMGLALGLC